MGSLIDRIKIAQTSSSPLITSALRIQIKLMRHENQNESTSYLLSKHLTAKTDLLLNKAYAMSTKIDNLKKYFYDFNNYLKFNIDKFNNFKYAFGE